MYQLIEDSRAKGNSDICSGKLYKEKFGNYSFNFITLSFNTDGIPVFKSSNYSFWPQFLIINELPFHMRSGLHWSIAAHNIIRYG